MLCHRALYLLILILLFVETKAQAPAATEFPKEVVVHLKLGTGLIAVPNTPEYFQGSLQLIPQYSLVPYRLRAGAVVAAVYTGRQVNGLFGPTVSLKVLELKGGYFGSIGNLHLSADHLWGTAQQRLAGGGLNLDLLNKFVLGLSYHRDYHLNSNWWASSIAFRVSKVKKPQESFPN